MCLGIPGKVTEMRDDLGLAVGTVDFGGVRREVCLAYVADEVSVGDYVIVHVGFAISRVDEDEARRTFEAGKATFERQWPYAYALGNKKGSKVKDKFKVAPYPPFEGGGKAAILGGHNSVISVYSKTPVLTKSYEDPAVKKALPFIDQLKQAVEQAKSRPVSPVYTQISQAIYKNVNAALSGSTDPKAALSKAQDDMDKALATF